jgi:hypothetical protein
MHICRNIYTNIRIFVILFLQNQILVKVNYRIHKIYICGINVAYYEDSNTQNRRFDFRGD